jgi:lysophospholipase L1-like esterase
MGYHFAGIGLGPILLVQGIYVRCVTPRLPEPSGVRYGVHGAGKSLRLLVAGDSAAAGVGADSQSSALTGQLVSALAPHFYLSWRLIARTGHKVHDLLKHIESADQEAFDLAVVSVGVNDVTGGTPRKKWQDLLGHLCDLLKSKFGIQYVFLTCIPPMQAFPALPKPLGWYLGKRAASLNRAMSEVTARREDCEFVQPVFPLTREFIAADGFHPSSVAYTTWAEHIAAAIRKKWQ